MLWLLMVLALLIVIAGLLFLKQGQRAREATGIPTGEVVYTDTGAWEQVPKPLVSRRYGLVGKPDYLVQIRVGSQTTLVPVEVKSRRRPAVTPDSHILQLATYCLLVEDVHKMRPAYGLLHYADATLKIPYTDELRRAVLEIADAIRQARSAPDLHRDHHDPSRCRGCGYAYHCGEVVES
jgi:CRISPR-associated exonuclease Cas4